MVRHFLPFLALLPAAGAVECHAVSQAATDAWCNNNCNMEPRNCPKELCECNWPTTTTPPPAPPTPPVPPTPPPPPTPPTPHGDRGMELLGWLENWGPDIKWWDNDMPGNCLMGCFKNEPLIEQLTPYSSVNYGFSFLTTHPDPDQVDCGDCPEWDGERIYLAAAAKGGSVAVDSSTTIQRASPSIIAIAEVVRMARMHPSGPKRVKITLGGWSDFARMSTVANGIKAAKLMGKLVAFTFADGVDVDMEHLSPFADMGDEFGAFHAFINQLRVELNDAAANWVDNANARREALAEQFAQLQNWQKAHAGPYYNSSQKYLEEVASNGAPYLEISWTTRFNAFLPDDDVWNYLLPDSPRPNTTFVTDNEGSKIWPEVGHLIDTVNIMAYDAGTDAGALKLNFTTILSNFATIGNVPASKINMGFEPGEQAAGGEWEGQSMDEAVARDIKEKHTAGGSAIWAVNPNAAQHPQASTLCPRMARSLNQILSPTFAFDKVPKYTKCGSDGWWPGLLETAIVV